MNKKKILIIVLSCILLVGVCVGVTFALWGKSISSEKETGANSGDWTESEKFIKFGVIMKPGTSEQIGWSVTGLTNPQKTITVPKQHRANKNSAYYPVTEIDSSFSNISGVEEINLPNTIKVIKTNAFVKFSDLKKVTFAAGATFAIGDTAFNACDMLEEFIYNGSTITSIGVDAFMGCVKLIAPTV